MKNPWLAWYPSDYIGKTRFLSMSQHGAYLLLLWEYYINGPIPAHAQHVLNICSAHDQQAIDDVTYVLGKFFHVVDGVYRHDRADIEIAKREDIRTKRVKAGQARQRVASTCSAHAQHMHTQPQPQSQSQEDQKRKPGDDYDSAELGSKEIDGQVHEIALLHPRIDDAFNLPYDIAIQIAEAVARDGRDVVWTGTKALADAVAGWPVTELKFIPSPQKFFRESNYRKPLEFWTRSNGNGNGNKRQTSAVEQRVSGNREVLSEALRTHVAQRVGPDGDKLQDGDGAQAKRRVSAGAL